MKTVNTIAAISAVTLCALAAAGSAGANKRPADPNGLEGTYQLIDSAEPKGQPKTVVIRRSPGSYRHYYAYFKKSGNKCPASGAGRPWFMTKFSLGQSGKTYTFKANGKKVPGNLMIMGSLQRCSSANFVKTCKGRGDVHMRPFGAYFVKASGRVKEIHGHYQTEYFRKGRSSGSACNPHKPGYKSRTFKLVRIR